MMTESHQLGKALLFPPIPKVQPRPAAVIANIVFYNLVENVIYCKKKVEKVIYSVVSNCSIASHDFNVWSYDDLTCD